MKTNVQKEDKMKTKVESKAKNSTVGKDDPSDVSIKDPSETESLISDECSMELITHSDDVPDDVLQVDSNSDVLESKGLHLQVVVTDTTKAVLTSDDSLLYSSHPPDPGSLLCLSDLTETRPGPRRKGRIKLVKGSNIYSILILLFCNI